MTIEVLTNGTYNPKTVDRADGFAWTQNVRPQYKGMSTEQVRSELVKTQFPFSVLMENFNHDFNVSVVVRNTNAFNGKEMFYFSPSKQYDKRGAVGCYHYTDVTYLPTLEKVLELKERYTFIGVDCIPGSKSMTDFVWPDNTLMLFGSEGVGLSPALQSLCEHIVHIDQFGSVPSLNAAVASGITMFDFTTKYRAKNSP